MAAILKNLYDVMTQPSFVWLLRNLPSRCRMTCMWLHIGQYGNRK